ncbi:MAG: glycosyltransferase family 2 protein [Pseudonocardiaceae bacterium]
MKKSSEIDTESAVTDSVEAPDPSIKEYTRFVRWQEREKQARAVRMVELAPPTRPLSGFRFFGIVGTWMEEDIISASISNAFHQGCEKVFLVDNYSSDQTVENAVAGGATLAHSYRTDSYDEPLRIALMNAVMEEVTEQEEAASTWWLWFDADEFPHGPEGKPLKQYLESLDARYRVVGARYFHHFPTDPPHYISPYHPIQFQPLCYEQSMGRCGHRKPPLIRLDRGRPAVKMREGFQQYDSSEVLFEPSSPAFIHHFPFRVPEVTRRRMMALCAADDTDVSRIQQQDRHEIAHYGAPSHSSQRLALFDAVYSGHWDLVVREMPGRHSNDVIRRDWTDAFDSWEVDVWYSEDELSKAAQRRRANRAYSGQGKHAKR